MSFSWTKVQKQCNITSSIKTEQSYEGGCVAYGCYCTYYIYTYIYLYTYNNNCTNGMYYNGNNIKVTMIYVFKSVVWYEAS